MKPAVCYTNFSLDPFEAMAFDEWLLGRVLSDPDLIAVHLYSWSRGTVTFGLNQKMEQAVDRSLLGDTPLIRRITGGRALYHDPSELTYAIAASDAALNGGGEGRSGDGSVRQIAAALSLFLMDQDIRSEYARQSSLPGHSPGYFHTAPCFDSRARYELVAAGRKVVASAQRRMGSVMLQHGAIKLAGVAQHPALNKNVDQVEQLPQISPERFASLVSSFVATVGSSLGMRITVAELTAKQTGEVTKVARQVIKNAHIRRNIVKQ